MLAKKLLVEVGPLPSTDAEKSGETEPPSWWRERVEAWARKNGVKITRPSELNPLTMRKILDSTAGEKKKNRRDFYDGYSGWPAD